MVEEFVAREKNIARNRAKNYVKKKMKSSYNFCNPDPASNPLIY